MRRGFARSAFLALTLALAGCGGVPLMVLGGLASAGSIYTTVDKLTEAVDPYIEKACAEYEKHKATADAVIGAGLIASGNAAKVASIKSFGDAACVAPPAGDPLSTAIWLGGIGGQLSALTARAGS